ncbi:MAG: hypothetical protein H0T78_09615 [Longispora sp.]|nr:hypothetical protein [Longispora sp. (in: high G+C Gram-positive bacteria)]
MDSQVDRVAAARRAAGDKLAALRAKKVDSFSALMKYCDRHGSAHHFDPEGIKKIETNHDNSLEHSAYALVVADAESIYAAAILAADRALADGLRVERFVGNREGETDGVKIQDVTGGVLAGYKAFVNSADETYISSVNW